MAQDIDLAGLVADGHLDLVAAFEDADWEQVDHAVDYVLCGFGPNNEPGTVEIYIQVAEAYGVRAYRWSEAEGDDSEPYLSEAEALAAAKAHAAELDETPDVDEQITEILETGFFGRGTTADDIRRVTKAMTDYRQGVLLLARGEVPPTPIGVAWTTSGWLECEHISVPADCDSEGVAAARLLSAIKAYEYDGR